MSQTIVGLFHSQEQAREAVRELKNRGFSEEEISLVARDEDADRHGDTEMTYDNQNLADGTATGGAIGGLAGLLAGAGALLIPGIGPIIAAGPLAGALTGIVTGGIAGGLIDYGIPEEQGKRYERELDRGKVMVAVTVDSEEDAHDAAAVLRSGGAYDVQTHDDTR